MAQDVPDLDLSDGINVQNYRPVMDAERTLWTDDTGGITDKPVFNGRVFLHYVRNPLVFVSPDRETTTKLVSNALQLDALAMLHFNRFRLGVDIPVYLNQAGELTDTGAGLGDIALDGRVTILDRADNPVGVSAGGRLTLPTETVDTPLGWEGLAGEFYGAVDAEVDKWIFAGNLGARFVPGADLTNISVGNQLFGRAGAGYQIVEDAGISADVNVSAFLGEFSNEAGIPLEGLLGGWGRLGPLVLRGGVGTGFTRGIGAGDLRIVTAIGYEPRPSLDPDGDGIVGADDQCPDNPEDKDGFEDENGCPDPDNDADGIVDVDDQCPMDPEDPDGFKDDDGCPDYSTQVTVKVQRQNGLPVPGATSNITGDGLAESGPSSFVIDLHEGSYAVKGMAPDYIENAVDFVVPLPEGQTEVVVVLQPDVISGDLTVKVQDTDGNILPDPIWYMDGGVGPAPIDNGTVTVKVPAGEHALDVRHEGYVTDRRTITVPPKAAETVVIQLKKSNVQISKERIDIRDTVYFDTAKARIQPRSFGLLDDVAGVLLDHPELVKVRIEGHTDSRGGADYNRRLSDDRAKAVRTYLIGKGVAADRLEAIGYGEDRPVDPANNEAAWEKNRRVDFFIVERSD
jgi:outer membrane protein OmpA-like peptidoglycan-associated protein